LNQLPESAQQLTETNQSQDALRESNFRLQLAVESANIGIYELNVKNGELLWDDRVRAQWGLPPGVPVDYNTFLKGVHPDDREATQAAIDRALDPNGDGRCRVEFRVIGIQDGIERWIVGTGQVFFENGQAERLVGTTFDITARKHAEQRLRESEERFRTLADSSPVPIWVTDASGGIEFLNAAYSDFFGVTLEDVRGPKWAMLLHPDDADPYVGAYYEALRQRKPFRSEARVRRGDGEWRWVDTRGVPRFSEGGEFLGHVGSSPDVTEMKIAQQALRESEEQFRASFEISTVGMAQADPITGRLLRVNRRYCEMTGYSEAEVLQLSIRTLPIQKIKPPTLNVFSVSGAVRCRNTGPKSGTCEKTEELFGLRQRPISCAMRAVNRREPWRSLLTLRVASKPKRPCVKARLNSAPVLSWPQ
jgi:PAS domain S-box-containing protein